MNKKISFVFHPSYYIQEYLDEIQMTQDEFAKRLGITGKQVSLLLKEEANITADIAYKLSKLLGTSVELWLTLQAKYDAFKIEEEQEELFEEEKKVYKMIDRKFLLNLNIIDKNDKINECVAKLRHASMVSSLTIHYKNDICCSYRTAVEKEETIENVVCRNVWVSIANSLAMKENVSLFNEQKLIDNIPYMRSMTLMKPEEFYPKLKSLLSECGVSLVILPSLKNSNINGVVKWYNSNKNVMMALNTRGAYNDKFWFSFFHELKHVLQKVKRKMIVNDSVNKVIDGILEYEADKFARDTLIDDNLFAKLNNYSEYSIIAFAKKINIHPGIVVGRLQKDGKIKYSQFNYLKEKYEVRIN